jgi:hypothetical protein
MVLYEKPECIWEKYFLTALDFYKFLDKKEKQHIDFNKNIDFELVYTNIMDAKNRIEEEKEDNVIDFYTDRHELTWWRLVDLNTLIDGDVSDVEIELMDWLIDNLIGTYDIEWVAGDYAEYDRYTGAKLKNLYRESDGWHVRLMKRGEFN